MSDKSSVSGKDGGGRRGTGPSKTPGATENPTVTAQLHQSVPDPPTPPPIMSGGPSPVVNIRVSAHKLLNSTKHRVGVLKVLKELVHMQRDLLTDLQVLTGVFLLTLEEQVSGGNTVLERNRNTMAVNNRNREINDITQPTTHLGMMVSLRKLLEKIVTTNRAILFQLEGRFKAIKLGEYACVVSDIIEAVANALKHYDGYPEAINNVLHVIEENKSKKEFNETLFLLSQQPETRNQPIKFFLKRPLEFVDKYFLLGKVLLIYTHQEQADYLALVSALEKMAFELKKIKKQEQQQHNKNRMIVLSYLLQDIPFEDKSQTLLSGNRELIYEVPCWRMTDRGKNYKSSAWQKHSLQLFLFSDMLLLTKKRKAQLLGSSEAYVHVATLSLSRTVFNVVDTAEQKNMFELREVSLSDTKEDLFFTLCTEIPEKRDAFIKQLNKAQFRLLTGYQHTLSETRKEKIKKLKNELADTKGKLAKEKQRNTLLKEKVFEFKKMVLAGMLPQVSPELMHHGKMPRLMGSLPTRARTTSGQEIREGIELKSFQPVEAPPSGVISRRHKRAHSVGEAEEHHTVHNPLMEKYGLDDCVKHEQDAITKQHATPMPVLREPTSPNPPPSITVQPTVQQPQPTTLPSTAVKTRTSSPDLKHRTKRKKVKEKKKEKEKKEKEKKKKKRAESQPPQPPQPSPVKKEAAEPPGGSTTTKKPRELMQRIGNIQKEKQGDEVKYWLV